MFESLFANDVTLLGVILMAVAALFGGIAAAFIYSLKLRSGKGFFVTVAILPAIVSLAFCLFNVVVQNDVTTAITSIGAVMIGLGLIRFRSAQGKAEEMLALFNAVAIGAVNGLGYWAYASGAAVVIPLIYVGLMCLPIFKNKRLSAEKLLRITVPENLEYGSAFDEVFSRYLKEAEAVGVKTTGMGSMYRLSYRVVLKDANKEKEFIDELRVKNGNLEISLLPYVDNTREL